MYESTFRVLLVYESTFKILVVEWLTYYDADAGLINILKSLKSFEHYICKHFILCNFLIFIYDFPPKIRENN